MYKTTMVWLPSDFDIDNEISKAASTVSNFKVEIFLMLIGCFQPYAWVETENGEVPDNDFFDDTLVEKQLGIDYERHFEYLLDQGIVEKCEDVEYNGNLRPTYRVAPKLQEGDLVVCVMPEKLANTNDQLRQHHKVSLVQIDENENDIVENQLDESSPIEDQEF